MNENTPAVRPRIDAAQIDEWRNEALAAARNGTDERAIESWLKENGCPPRTRQDILLKARAERRTHHRGVGVKAMGLGLLAFAGGAALLAVSVGGVPVGDGTRIASPRGALAGAGLIAVGLPPLLFGVWKMLTGSAVEVQLPER